MQALLTRPSQPIASESSDRHITLSSSHFRIAWLLINVFHIFNTSFALIAGAVHLILAIPQVYENMFLVRIPRPILQLAGWSYIAVASLHIFVVFHSIGLSVWRQRLTFGHDHAQTEATPTIFHVFPRSEGIGIPMPSRRLTRLESMRNVSTAVISAPVVVWKQYFGLYGLLGVFGPRFEVGFHSRQLLEITLQTYQAYQLSCGVPHDWINQFIVSMLVMNAFSTPAVEFFLKAQRPSLVRLTAIVIDLVIDFAITVVVPMCVIVPRLLEFNWSIGTFPAELIYDDLWLTIAVSEARQVFVTSNLDYISSLLPPFLWLIALDTVKNMLRREPHRSKTHTVVVSVQARKRSLFEEGCSEWKKLTAVKNRRSTLVNRISMCWGVGVMTLHLMAMHPVTDNPQSSVPIHQLCKLRLKAWLAQRFPCSVVMIDCNQQRISGDTTTVESYLATFDRGTLTKVIFSHCPALHVPPVLAEFSQLRSFVTFNATITAWPTTAALTRTHTPLVVALDMIDTNMTALPDGIHHDNLPHGLNLLLYRSNLSSLPDDIGTVWGSHKWVSLWMEHTELKELPRSFRDLQIQKLALMSNQQLTNFHEDVFEYQAFSWLRFSRNVLVSKLPETLGDTSRLSHLLCEDTDLKELPDQLQRWVSSAHGDDTGLASTEAKVISFRGSPLCKTLPVSNPQICNEVSDAVKDEFRYDLIIAQRRIE